MLAFEREDDARRVMDVLPKRFERFGLTLHPEKTRLLDFRHPWRRASDPPPPPGERGPRVFDFLGFQHLWMRTRKGGHAVRQKTAPKRLSRALKAINQWCRANRHRPLDEQYRELLAKLHGHYGYYNRIGNLRALAAFRNRLVQLWQQWLNRRSQRARLWWHRFRRIMARFRFPHARRLEAPATANP